MFLIRNFIRLLVNHYIIDFYYIKNVKIITLLANILLTVVIALLATVDPSP